MSNSKITFKEENINIGDAKKILDIYDESRNEEYKKWLEEITPFRDFYPSKNWRGWRDYCIYNLQIFLRIRKDMFRYKWVSFLIEQADKDRVFLKWYTDWELKVVFKLKKWKKLLIDTMISLEKWIWRRSLKVLCEHYNTFSIVVKPSVYGRWFWEKMQKEYKNFITITIQ